MNNDVKYVNAKQCRVKKYDNSTVYFCLKDRHGIHEPHEFLI